MKFTMYHRDFSEMAVPLDLDFSVEKCSWAAVGGCKQATITAVGEDAVLKSLLNHLRAPVEIFDDKGNKIWWGFLASVSDDARIGFSADIAAMYNRVRVGYSTQNIRFTTEVNEDAELVAEFGKKEILLSATEAGETQALVLRDTFLAQKKKIKAGLTFGGGGENKMTLTCLGWYYTLDWEYYLNLTGKESYEITGEGGREIGEDNRPILGQSFELASAIGWPANAIWLRPWKQGSSVPVDNLVVSLCANYDTYPGTVLASSTKAAADIGSQAEWLEFPLSAAVDLDPATVYWIKVERSGAVNAAAYFMVDTNREAGYPRGILRLWNTDEGGWVTEPESWQGDLIFKVVGTSETTGQIVTLVESAAQFFEGTHIEDASGVVSNPFRDGDTPALYELEKLLAAGTTNYRRLLAEVTPSRYLRIYEEPAPPADPADTIGLTKDGQLQTAAGTPIEPVNWPVAVWAHLVDVIPPTVDLSIVDDPSLFFIEEIEYNAVEGTSQIVLTRDQEDIFDFSGAVEG